ncbi:MAG: anti-sigma factor [Acidobacteriota bacterium]
MDHDSLREQSGAYALGLLTLSERREFEAHLETCAECREELRELAMVTESLGRMVVPREPPAGLRDRVMHAVAAPTAPARSRPRRMSAAPAWLLLAASLGLMAVGLYAAVLHQRVRQSEALARRTELILAAADVKRVDLAGQDAAPNASGRAFWSRSRGVMFTATGLPPLPKGKVYQLWVVTGSAPLSAGLLTPDAAGHAAAVADMPPDVVPVAVAVTIEPEGGVPSPTGAKYLVGAV